MTVNSTISHEIANVLRDEILRQQYRSGERLPSERDLASRFDASRGAVREALSQLEQLGLILILPGGARVQAIESARIAILGPLMDMNEVPDSRLVGQFFQTFGVLTALNASTAIENASAEQLDHLRSLLDKLAKHAGDFEAMQPHWREFLQTLASIADNLVVRLISNDLKAQFVEQIMKLGIKPQLKKQDINQLVDSLKHCLVTRNAELAAATLQAHFNQVQLAVIDAIKTKQASYQKEAV